jgi:hypothetical protein
VIVADQLVREVEVWDALVEAIRVEGVPQMISIDPNGPQIAPLLAELPNHPHQ